MKRLLKGARKHRNPGAPRLPAHPYRLCALGQSGSGKTFWLIRHLILDEQSPFDRIIWVAPEDSLQQKIVQDMVKAFHDDKVKGIARDRFVTVDGITDPKSLEKLNAYIDEGHEQGLQQLVVLDDLISDIGKSTFVDNLFTSGRHKNLSVAELAQRCFTPGTRTHRIGTDFYAIFGFGDKTEASMLFRQIAPEDWKQLRTAYADATRGGPGNGFVIDQLAGRSANPADHILRFRKTSLVDVYPELRNAR